MRSVLGLSAGWLSSMDCSHSAECSALQTCGLRAGPSRASHSCGPGWRAADLKVSALGALGGRGGVLGVWLSHTEKQWRTAELGSTRCSILREGKNTARSSTGSMSTGAPGKGYSRSCDRV